MDTLIQGVDIYAEFGVAPDASEADIKQKYRKLALQFHPDKDPSAEAHAKFHLHQAIYSVLTLPQLRRQYDEMTALRAAPGSGASSSSSPAAKVMAFRAKLAGQERAAKPPAHEHQQAQVQVQMLSQKGTVLRRNLQHHMQQGGGYIGSRELEVPQYMTGFLHKSVHVWWKQKPDPGAHIDGAILAEVMAGFGAVAGAEVLGPAGKYCQGKVRFQRAIDAQAASSHDYTKSSSLWRHSRVRKQASLLRRVEFVPEPVDAFFA